MRIHVAGIVPIANIDTDHDNAHPAVLTPIANGYSALQKSIYECALAGCRTIWVIANDDMIPLIRKTVGEWVYDPVYYKRDFTKFYSEQRKEVPIYYVPIHPKDRARRDSYGWSVLHGIHSAWRTSHKLSRWIEPQKYYISFPMGLFDFEKVRKHRKHIRHKEKNFFFSFQGKTIKDNLPLSFTMTGEDFKICRRHINQKTTREYLPPSPDQRYPTEKLPLAERWSARRFPMSTVFHPISTATKIAQIIDADWFYDASEWEQYKRFIASSHELTKPYVEIIRPRLHNKVAIE